MKHTKGLLLLSFWLLAMPFAFAQVYKKVTPTAQYKQQGGFMYCTLTHGPINMRLTMEKEGASEHIMPATLQFLISHKPVGNTEYTNAEDPLNNFYFYEQAGEYYIFQELYDDMMVYYGAYKVSGAEVTSLGDFYCEDYQDYITNEFTSLSIPATDTAWFVICASNGKKIELKKSTYVDTHDTYVYTNPPLLEKHNAFNWQKGFTPTLKNTIIIDLNTDGASEKYNIDWAKKEITYANYDGMLLLKKNNAKEYISFKGDTLLLQISKSRRTDIDIYTYYFSISKKYNTACLDKYSYYTYKSHNGNGKTVVTCNFKEDYLPDYWWWIPTLEYFSVKDEGQDIFHIWNYERRFTISSLTKMLSKKETANNLENGCALLPDFREIELFFENNPLTAGNVQQYNDLAYYMLEYNHVNDEIDRRPLLSGAQKMLEDITTQFPDRIVAWLNLADFYYQDKSYKDRVAPTYNKYLELMKAQGKEAKVPQRVYERI